ncbi:MAG TPA: XdhC/CoxI family protein [Dehalococcoidia bacterium]|nr:XdhC/CoxI family protein [Dehalococcoidia bacterium]
MPSVIAEIARAVLAALEGGEPVVTATVIRSDPGQRSMPVVGSKLLVRPDGSTVGTFRGGAIEQTVKQACLDQLRRHGTRLLRLDANGGELDDRHVTSSLDVLIEVVETPPVLLIVGAGHIGRSLCKLAAEVGFAVTVLDDRPDYANRERLPEATQVLCQDFDEALKDFPITPNTYIVMVSRGHKQDELSLRRVVGKPAAYIGMIGSKRRTGTVLQHLEAEGVPRAALDAVHTPIGLDIGAETPEEIAVSILAEMIMVRRGGSGRTMYYRRGGMAELETSGAAAGTIAAEQHE